MSARLVSFVLMVAFATAACQRKDNTQPEDARDSTVTSDNEVFAKRPVDWPAFELIFSFKDKEVNQKLGVKFLKVDAIEFRLLNEDQLCNSEFWGVATNRVAHTEFEGDKDDTGALYLADEFVLEDSTKTINIRIAETRDKARIRFTDKANSDDECRPESGLLLRAEDVQ